MEKSPKPQFCGFSTLWSQAGARERDESLLPWRIHVRRAQMVPISVKLVIAPSVPTPVIITSPRREQRARDTTFELSRNPGAALIDCLPRVIIIIKPGFRNCK